MPITRKLGKLAPRIDKRTLKLDNYLKVLPAIPLLESWLYKPENDPNFNWQMFKNDEIGDCAIAGPAHIEMLWTNNSSLTPFAPTDDQVIAEYTNVSGYNPQDPNTDNGCVLLDVMNRWRNYGLFGRKITSYVSVNPRNLEHVKAAIHLFGAINIGLSLPASAQGQDIWTVTDPTLHGDAAPGSWGGHCVIIGEYDALAKEFVCITWGARLRMSFDFFTHYCDEAYAALSNDWISTMGLSPGGFDVASLQKDLKIV